MSVAVVCLAAGLAVVGFIMALVAKRRFDSARREFYERFSPEVIEEIERKLRVRAAVTRVMDAHSRTLRRIK